MDNFRDKYRFRFNNDFFVQPVETDNFIIYQIGDLFCDCGTEIGNHKQDMEIELSFVDDGAGAICSNGISVDTVKGDIYLSLKNDEHSIKSNNTDTLRFYYIALDVKASSPLKSVAAYLQKAHKNERNRIFRFPYIFSQMTNILSEITYRNGYYLQMIDNNLSQIIIALYRDSTNQVTSLNNYQTDSKNGMIYNIAHYIGNNLCSISNLSELADEFSYDYSYISKRFKTVMHKSMQTYFQDKKFEYAKQLLTQEHKSVTKVAEILNYSSIHNFSRAFKNHFGVSPQELVSIENNQKTLPTPEK